VGGGEGRTALERYGSLGDVTHAFTAGGTILKALADRPLPFLEALAAQAAAAV
jgi:3-phosphoglycerate kinase